MLSALDLSLFRLINLQFTHPWADVFFTTITDQDVWIYPIVFLLTFLIFFNARRGRILFVLILITLSLTDAVSYRIIKPGFKRVRPCHELQEVRVLEKCGGRYSMPSNHAANFFAAATLLSLFFRRGRFFFFLIAFLSGGYARVYVGKHYPGDVLVGALFGILIALAVYYLWVIIRVRLEKQEKFFLSI